MCWFFGKDTEAQKYLRNKKPHTKEGREIISEALAASYKYPNLTGPELIRLAYWGTSG